MQKQVNYAEGIFVGYRYYDARKMDVLFPFGYGLSYTEFSYSNLMIDKSRITAKDTLMVSLDVTNTGSMEGKEIVQLYVSDKTHSAIRPVRELKIYGSHTETGRDKDCFHGAGLPGICMVRYSAERLVCSRRNL